MKFVWRAASSHGSFPERCSRPVSEDCVHQLFEAQAARSPDSVAITCGTATLSYAQLNGRANQIAHWLQRHGVRPEKLVGLCVERSLDAIAALLGILKAGGAYVPLDPAFPQQRLAQILEDSQPEVMITHAALATMVPPLPKHTLLVDTPELDCLSRKNPSCDVQPHHLAYVIFTTGSTGRPKGVQIEHRSLVNFLGSMARKPGITAADILVAVTTFSFDIAGLEIFLPLITGACVVLAPPDVVINGSALQQLLESSNATVMQATPTTWRMMLDSGWKGSDRLKILCGGEAMPSDLAKELIPRCASLWNLYGPTETTIWSTMSRVSTEETRIPIGKPIANTEAHIVDHELRPVPVGEVGELLIGGEGVARGYLNRPDLTAERFVPNPFSRNKDERVYRTGDLCRSRPDGMIEFVGRNDRQVKIRGYRVELGEIEAALESHPGVKQAAVKVVGQSGEEKTLVGYVVANGVRTQDLRTYLAERLPTYMLPSIYINLTHFPLTPNRKVDRNALPLPLARDSAAAEQRSTGTSLQIPVAEMAANLLGLDSVRTDDNFFLIGGHSLFCTQLVARIREKFGIELPLRSIFESPTPALLAQEIEGMMLTKIRTTNDQALRVNAASVAEVKSHREQR